MKYYKDGQRPMLNADQDQIEIVEAAGWSQTKPEVAPPKKVEPKKVEPKKTEPEKAAPKV